MHRDGAVVADDPAAVHDLCVTKATTELHDADLRVSDVAWVPWTGDVMAEVVLVKGGPGPAEASGGGALTGQDGEAIRKALEALGFDSPKVFCTLSRPSGPIDAAEAARRICEQVETVDPQAVIALDGTAASDLAAAFGLPRLEPGKTRAHHGRTFLALDGFEASLGTTSRKRKVWNQLRNLKPRGSAW